MIMIINNDNYINMNAKEKFKKRERRESTLSIIKIINIISNINKQKTSFVLVFIAKEYKVTLNYFSKLSKQEIFAYNELS